jgi:hypothetical protein
MQRVKTIGLAVVVTLAGAAAADAAGVVRANGNATGIAVVGNVSALSNAQAGGGAIGPQSETVGISTTTRIDANPTNASSFSGSASFSESN